MSTEFAPRITASMIPKYVGKDVLVVGEVDASQISQDGGSFAMNDGEGNNIKVTLSSPLNDIIEGTIEVVGKVDNQCQVNCLKYVHLPPSAKGDKFNLQLYNESLKLLHTHTTFSPYREGLKRNFNE